MRNVFDLTARAGVTVVPPKGHASPLIVLIWFVMHRGRQQELCTSNLVPTLVRLIFLHDLTFKPS